MYGLKSYLKNRASACLIMSEENVSYFTSFHSTNGYLLVTGSKSVFLTDSRYIEAAKNKIKTCDEVLLFTGIEESLVPLLKKLSVNELLIEGERVSVSKFNSLKKIFDFLSLSGDGELDEKINEIRSVKRREETDNIIKAQRIAEEAFLYMLDFIEVGVTEKEIALELDHYMLQNGADGLSFETIAVSGKNSSMPHGVPSDKKIERGDFITMDFGAVKNFYHSDMTRTVAVGEVSSKQAEVYETVLKAQNAAFSKLKSEVSCFEADKAARDVIENAGYGKYFGHGTGHGVGIEIHEFPVLSPKSKTILKPGHIVTNEPGIYLPGEFGVRIEDMALITEDGYENLTRAEKNLIVL